ncbi:hypothetical protein L596_019072 [Steinernema carpocapsae]|uniref:Uncharacterized protein n=1 Tax=Steinernema carpocapsae TaxID=34508 RepID=A0A4U5N8D1_STECR|nr:hypothetical protein L596_019072 [Steinernema carpocapsae]
MDGSWTENNTAQIFSSKFQDLSSQYYLQRLLPALTGFIKRCNAYKYKDQELVVENHIVQRFGCFLQKTRHRMSSSKLSHFIHSLESMHSVISEATAFGVPLI